MTRLRRRWRILKWAGLMLSLFVVIAWAVSLFYYVRYSRPGPGVPLPRGRYVGWYFGVSQGVVGFQNRVPFPEQSLGWHISTNRFSTIWLPTVVLNHGQGADVFTLPFWIPFLLVAIPTAYLFRRDGRRRIPPGHCQKCGYNLTGNISGVCPECGEPIPDDPRVRRR
jgi:hypothetical protein